RGDGGRDLAVLLLSARVPLRRVRAPGADRSRGRGPRELPLLPSRARPGPGPGVPDGGRARRAARPDRRGGEAQSALSSSLTSASKAEGFSRFGEWALSGISTYRDPPPTEAARRRPIPR